MKNDNAETENGLALEKRYASTGYEILWFSFVP